MKKIFLWLLLVLAAATFWSCSDDSSTEPAPNTPTAASITVSVTSLTFGNVENGSLSAEQNFTISGANLTSSITVKAPTGFQVSTTTATGFTDSVVFNSVNGTLATTTVYAKFKPTAAQAYCGNIALMAKGVSKSVAVNGTGTAGLEMNFAGYGTTEASGYRITSETHYWGKDAQNNWKVRRKWEFVYQNNQIVKIMETDQNNVTREVPVTYQYGKPAQYNLDEDQSFGDYEYYADGKLKKVIYSSSSYKDYLYGAEKLSYKKSYSNNQLTDSTNYICNASGKLIGEEWWKQYNNQQGYTYLIFNGNRLVSANVNDPGDLGKDTIRYSYNSSNFCTKSSGNNRTYNYTYDSANRLNTIERVSPSDNRLTTYTYDGYGNVIGVLYNDLDKEQAGDHYVVSAFEQGSGNFKDFFPWINAQLTLSKTSPVGWISHLTTW